MKKSAFIILTPLLLLTGCATTETQTSQAVEYNANNSFEYFYANAEKMKQAGKAGDPRFKGLQVKWIQPANKNISCKIYSDFYIGTDPISTKNKVFWDGDCKNGYAYGMGREFVKGEMIDQESLAEYTGGMIRPTYYLTMDKLNHFLTIGDADSGMFITKELRNNEYGTYIESKTYNIDFQNTGAVYTMSEVTYAPKTIIFDVGTSMNNPNYTLISYSRNPYIKSEFNDISYHFTIKALTNNRFSTINSLTRDAVSLPRPYLENVEKLVPKMAMEIKASKANIEFSESKIRYYKSLICNSSKGVSFMNNSEYYDICHSDYFAKYEKSIAASREAFQQQEEQNQKMENMRAEQEYRNKMLDMKKQQIQQEKDAESARYFRETVKGLQDMNERNKPINCSTVGGVTTCF